MRRESDNVSPGTRDDLAGGRSLASLHPFFGDEGAAERFVELGFAPYLGQLAKERQPLRCIDLGGGEGIVASAFFDYCKSHEIEAFPIVLDQNSHFLRVAEKRGLGVVLDSIENFDDECMDCAILRFVNHYNDSKSQARIASSVSRIVRSGGILATQIETGSEQTCAMLGEIAALLSEVSPGSGRHWLSQDAFEASYRAVGFELEAVHGAQLEHSAPVRQRLSQAWDRIVGPKLWDALVDEDEVAASRLLGQRREFMDRARDRLDRQDMPETVQTKQPLMVFRRT